MGTRVCGLAGSHTCSAELGQRRHRLVDDEIDHQPRLLELEVVRADAQTARRVNDRAPSQPTTYRAVVVLPSSRVSRTCSSGPSPMVSMAATPLPNRVTAPSRATAWRSWASNSGWLMNTDAGQPSVVMPGERMDSST